MDDSYKPQKTQKIHTHIIPAIQPDSLREKYIILNTVLYRWYNMIIPDLGMIGEIETSNFSFVSVIYSNGNNQGSYINQVLKILLKDKQFCFYWNQLSII